MGKGKGGHRHFVMPDDPMAPQVLLVFLSVRKKKFQNYLMILKYYALIFRISQGEEEKQRKPKTIDEILDLEVQNPNRVKAKEFVKLTENVEPPKRDELSRKERKALEEAEEKRKEATIVSEEELEKIRIIREKREIEEKRRKEELERIEQNKLAAQKRIEELLAKKQNGNKKGKKKKS